ncbi:MAG: DHA2 family efflux MFS transporter permease subunit [Chloroflexi bacterium]|nr:DHA2 family efflux MFS transporter permease subunit [Chloroflexota bacterium]
MATAQSARSYVPANTEIWVLGATILASAMAFIDGSALSVALPALQVDLNATGTEMLWIQNSYLLFLAALILVGGSLGDIYGRKRVFMIGIGIFAVASVLCGLAPDPNALIIGRALKGIGGALMIPGSLAILSASFEPARRGRAIGTWSMFSTLTTLIGPVLGGWLAGQGLWRAVFFINIPMALIALYVLATRVPESRDEHSTGRLDYLGAFLATVGLGGLTYGFTEASMAGFTAPNVLIGLIVGVIALVAFVIAEARSDHPMVPLSLFRNRTFAGTNLLTLFMYGALGISFFFLPINLIQVQGYPPDVAGLVTLPSPIILTLLSRRAGGLVDRFGPRLPLIVGPAIVAVGFFLMAVPGVTNGPDDYWLTFFPAIVVTGIGLGLTVAPLTTSVMVSAPSESSGTASGINNAVSRTANVLAIAILGAVMLLAFRGSLETRAAELDLPVESLAALELESANLAAAQAPEGLNAEQTAAVENAIDWAFVDAFRLIVLISVGLIGLSVVVAATVVERTLTEASPAMDPSTAPAADDEGAGQGDPAAQPARAVVPHVLPNCAINCEPEPATN